LRCGRNPQQRDATDRRRDSSPHQPNRIARQRTYSPVEIVIEDRIRG
jgi:hypothetical protein